tara:strand:- start:1035 stop:2381 length:1347 start_codon:yes stop_codon:yes gene_type:complete
MSEQETVQNEASEQSLAESVTELEQLTQYALEVEGEERDQLIEQIKSKCEEEGLTSDEAEALIEEIGLVQEAKKSTKESRGADKAGGETSDMKNAATDVTPAYDAPGSGSSAKPAKGKSPKRKADANSAGEGGGKVSEDTEVEEATAEVKEEMPKTKSACMQKFYEKMGKLRKADIMANYDSIMKSLDLQEETEDTPDHSPIDVSDDIEALTSGEELSEDFKTKAATIFEAAVQAKVSKVLLEKEVELEKQNEEKIQEEVGTIRQELTDQVDSYLNYVAEQWMEENKLAVEKGIRTEITESFIKGMKNLFNEHYITIPEDKVDVVDDLFQKVEDLETELNTQIQESVDLKKEISGYKKDQVVRNMTSDLSDTQAEKVKELAEGVQEEDAEKFEQKVQVIKENYFPKSAGKAETLIEEVTNNDESDEEIDEVKDDVMKQYMSALTRTVR